MWNPSCCKKFSRNFTLIEIIIVIVIIGILAVLAIPKVEVFDSIKLQTASKKLLSDIRYIQARAVALRNDTRLVFNTGSESYSAQWDNAGSWENLKDPFTRTDLVIDFTNDPQYTGVGITSANFGSSSTLRFNWEGVPQDSAGSNISINGTIVLGLKGMGLNIVVTPQIGRVEVGAIY